MQAQGKILLFGNPKLYETSQEIKQEKCTDLIPVTQTMHKAIINFRKIYKRGHAIAAPQIGKQ